jgi:hypothetical protein
VSPAVGDVRCKQPGMDSRRSGPLDEPSRIDDRRTSNLQAQLSLNIGSSDSIKPEHVSGQLSERLGDLTQARGTIRIKSAGARCLFYHPIGRNEHGDRVGGGIVLRQPGQRAVRSAA